MNSNSKGQALLLLLLSMGAILTVVLSVASRSVVDVSTTTKDEDSLRAFSAAEAGIEKVLLNPIAQGVPVTSEVDQTTQAQYQALSNPYTPANTGYIYPVGLPSGDTGTVWFIKHTGNDQIDPDCSNNSCFTGASLDICWGKPGNPPTAVEVSVLFESGGTLQVGRQAFDTDSVRAGANKFTTVPSGSCTIDGRDFASRTRVTFNNLSSNLSPAVSSVSGNMKFMRVRLLYNNSEEFFGVIASGLPNQGRTVDSTGTAGTSSRKVQVVSLYPEMPSIFDAALFSGNSIIK